MLRQSKKFLFVLEHFFPYIGGAEKLFYILTSQLAEIGHDVVVITTLHDRNLSAKEIHRNIQIIRINCWNRFGFTLFSLPSVIKHARSADFIHTTTYNAALPALISAKLFSKPVFITFHEVWGTLWKELPFISFLAKHAFYYFESLLLKLPFTKFIAVSEFTKRRLYEYGVNEGKIELIYNGLDYRTFDNLDYKPSQTFTYTYFGRLGISKGLNLLIPAAAQFRKTHPLSKFKLIIPKQPTSLYKSILALIKDNSLEEYIEMRHELTKDQLYAELLSSSCIVIPSYSEGFCFAAAEAVALGIPIISSNQGALAEVVSGKYILMEEMSVDGLSDALQKAYGQHWQEKSVRYFNLKDTVTAYNDLYEAY